MPPTRHRFVIRPLAVDGVDMTAPDPEPGVPIAPLAGARDAWLTQVEGRSVFAAWKHLQHRLGTRFQALPVLTGEDGERYPTGRIGVRFAAPVSDAQLQALAESADARLQQRSARTDRQAVFVAADPTHQFLPEVLERLGRDSAVEQAWLDAQSAYRR